MIIFDNHYLAIVPSKRVVVLILQHNLLKRCFCSRDSSHWSLVRCLLFLEEDKVLLGHLSLVLIHLHILLICEPIFLLVRLLRYVRLELVFDPR